MFTGIIEEVGTVKQIQHQQTSALLEIQAKHVLHETKLGDSIAVNGVCLTVTALHDTSFEADVMHETLRRSNLCELVSDSRVNLERALTLQARLGGHLVSGHVDEMGKIMKIEPDDVALIYSISATPKSLRYMIEKGSITIDGISLTIIEVSDESFKVGIIPHTASKTTLLEKQVGSHVNLECDLIGKYVEKLLMPSQQESSQLTTSFLSEHGFL